MSDIIIYKHHSLELLAGHDIYHIIKPLVIDISYIMGHLGKKPKIMLCKPI